MSEAGAEEMKGNPEFVDLVSRLAPKKTNQFGDAIVYYYGGFSSNGGAVQRQVRGKLKIQKAGYETVEIDLKQFLGPSFDSTNAVPFIEMPLLTTGK